MKNFNYQIIRLISTFFYAGYIPYGPGTFTSFLTVLIVFFLPKMSLISSIFIIFLLFFIGVFTGGLIAKIKNTHDPSIIVIDEVVGMWISLLFTPKTLLWYTISFVFFRFFDITKIFPINKFEKMRGGWGIMLDDVVAGLFSMVLVYLLSLIF